ncbi:hypothetical protein ACHAWF_007618 [Thalassiosira exigua]
MSSASSSAAASAPNKGSQDDNDSDQNRRVPNASRPGAYPVYPSNHPLANSSVTRYLGTSVEPGTLCNVPTPGSSLAGGTTSEPSAVQDATSSSHPLVDAETQHLENSHHVAAEAYLVEAGDPESDLPSATVVHTYFGIERKRLILLSSMAIAVVAIVLGCTLGILLPKANKGSTEASTPEVCGPLCGGTTLLDPSRDVFGYTCKDWDFNSTNLPLAAKDGGACADIYELPAYGCGCPGVEIPPNGCGMLCRDGTELPDSDLVVKDIHNRELSCRDWELKSLFETDPTECVNYNAIGALCQCPYNEPHPDACGSLCGQEDSTFYHSERHTVWDTMCGTWDTFSRFLPSWYNNDGGESCEEYYSDVQRGCACPSIQYLSPTCGTLCQERRICPAICQGGDGTIPDPSLVVRRETCFGWEQQSRLEVHLPICPFYQMAGAQCGCENAPPLDACGPLCGPNRTPPDLEMKVYGESCESWDYMSTFLPESYGKGADGKGGVIESCSKHFSGIAHGCGCPGYEPPTNGCGTLCADGSSLPDPTRVVNARTCRDLELLSLFETDAKQCSRYAIFGLLCGCPGQDKYEEECFELDHIMNENETYYFSSGGSLYSISFGADSGYFAQIQSNNDLFLIGRYNGMESDNVAVFGGGAPCGVHGPRSGSVAIVEDETVTEPTIAYVIEPSICVYHAELKVPRFCDPASHAAKSKIEPIF